jgi:hypothetical protein
VTVFQMLTGRLPFEADTPMGTALAHITTPIPDIHDFRADLSAGVQTVIERALAKDPADRYQRAGDLADALRALATGEPLPADDRPAPPGPNCVEGISAQAVPRNGDTLPPEGTWEGRPTPGGAEKRRGLPVWAWIGGAVVGVALLAGAAWRLDWFPTGDAIGGAAEVPPGTDIVAVEEAPNSTGSSSTDQPTPTATQTLTSTPIIESPTATPPLLESGYRLSLCDDGLCIGHMNGITELGLAGQFASISGYSWSPDGSQIVFSACAGAEEYCYETLYLVNRNGSDLTPLLNSPTTNAVHPAWSPDGEWIAYHDTGALRLIRPNGSDIRTIEPSQSDNPACPHSIAWSPDSQRLAWVGGICVPGNNVSDNVWVANWDGTEKHMIYQSDTFEFVRYSIGWSPDGDSVAAQLENGDIIAIDPDCYASTNGCDDSSWSIIPELPEYWLHTFYPQWGE